MAITPKTLLPTVGLALASLLSAQQPQALQPDSSAATAKINPEERYAALIKSGNTEQLDKALFDAAKRGDVASAEYLINKNANVNLALGVKSLAEPDKEDTFTPLLIAIQNNDKNMVALLLRYNADVTIQAEIYTPIYKDHVSTNVFALNKNSEIFELLLNRFDVQVFRDASGRNLLHILAGECINPEQPETLEMLEIMDRKGYVQELKSQADKDGNLPIKDFLKKAFLEIKNLNKDNSKPVFFSELQMRAARLLLPPKKEINTQTELLHYAMHLHPKAVELLLANGYDPNIRTPHDSYRNGVFVFKHLFSGKLPIETLILTKIPNPLTVADLLIKYRANAKGKDTDNRSLFDLAMKSGNIYFIEYLFSVDAVERSDVQHELNRQDDFYSSTKNRKDIEDTKKRIAAGGPSVSSDKLFLETYEKRLRIAEFLTSLVDGSKLAKNRSNKEVVEPLFPMQGKAENSITKITDASNPQYVSVKPDALYEAVRNGKVEDVKTLLAAGADVQSRYASDSTAENVSLLHVAAKYTNPEMIKFLVKKGVKIDAMDGLKQTPLHYAAEFGNSDTIQALLEAGADPNIISATGRNVAHYAVQSGDLAALKLLLKSGVNLTHKDAFGSTAFDDAILLQNGNKRYFVIADAISAAMNRANETEKPQNQR